MRSGIGGTFRPSTAWAKVWVGCGGWAKILQLTLSGWGFVGAKSSAEVALRWLVFNNVLSTRDSRILGVLRSASCRSYRPRQEHEVTAAAEGPNDSTSALSDARVGPVEANGVFLSTTPALSACAQVGCRLATIVVERRRYRRCCISM